MAGAPRGDGEGGSCEEGVRRHLRGSSLLLSGRCASLVINLGVQVLTVRYLAREEYGMFAWALVVVAMATHVTLLGLDKTISRFVAIYHERGDTVRVFGAIVLSGLVVVALGSAVVAGAYLSSGSLPRLLGAEPEAVSLLLVMIALGPLGAVDSLLHSLYATFGRARAIFVRRYLVGPGLKLASVVAVVALGGGAFELAIAYTASTGAAVFVYAALLLPILRGEAGLERERPTQLVLPARAMLGYAASLLGAELVFMFYNSFVTMLLEYHHGASEVAGFQAVRPFAKLSDVVFVAFVHLFVPALARFHARHDAGGAEQLYGRTCLWITLLGFPVFAVTFAMSDTVSVTLLGSAYADAGGLLAWMSLGFFLHAVLGVNSHALRVLGFVGTAMATDLLAVIGAVGIGLALIPGGGPAGAAATLALFLAGRGALHLLALYWRTGLHPLRGHGTSYAVVAATVVALVVTRPLTAGSLPGSAAAALAATLLVFAIARRRLDVAETFPELARLPFAAQLFPARSAS
jgi:O-antigen/teichoic acid export membrane protein